MKLKIPKEPKITIVDVDIPEAPETDIYLNLVDLSREDKILLHKMARTYQRDPTEVTEFELDAYKQMIAYKGKDI